MYHTYMRSSCVGDGQRQVEAEETSRTMHWNKPRDLYIERDTANLRAPNCLIHLLAAP